MNGSDQTHYVGLDVGTGNVRCVVATRDEQDGRATIIGHGSAPNNGMRRGSVVHSEDVTEAIIAAVTSAERLSGVRINRATVNINGTHVLGTNSKGVIAISGPNHPINDDDRARVEDAATVVKLPPNREIVQVFAKDYSLDGQGSIKDPVGMTGVRLEVDTHLVTAATPNLKSLNLALDKAQIEVNRYTVSSLAAAEAVMTRQQKEAGAVLVDIGAGTTNLAVLEEGEVQHVAVLPIGGSHLTNDLAIGLKTDLDVAEQVKLKFAKLSEEGGNHGQVKLKLGGHEYSYQSSDIAMITEARMEELFEYVNKELSRIHKASKLPGGVVLAGGGAKVVGLADFVREQLGLPTRMGSLQPIGGLREQVNDPSYYSAVGLVLLDMLLPSENQGSFSSVGDRFSGLVGNLRNRFRI